MLYTRRLLIVLSLVLSSFLVACGASGGDSSDAQGVDLSQSTSYEDEMGGTISISYPEGWVSDTSSGALNLASSQEVLDQMSNADLPQPESGQVLATAVVIPAEIVSFFVADGEEASATAIANAFISDLAEEEDNISEVEETTINEHPAAVITGTTEGVDVVMVALDLGDGSFAIVFGGTKEGEGSSIRPTITAMAGSLSYTSGSTDE